MNSFRRYFFWFFWNLFLVFLQKFLQRFLNSYRILLETPTKILPDRILHRNGDKGVFFFPNFEKGHWGTRGTLAIGPQPSNPFSCAFGDSLRFVNIFFWDCFTKSSGISSEIPLEILLEISPRTPFENPPFRISFRIQMAEDILPCTFPDICFPESASEIPLEILLAKFSMGFFGNSCSDPFNKISREALTNYFRDSLRNPSWNSFRNYSRDFFKNIHQRFFWKIF